MDLSINITMQEIVEDIDEEDRKMMDNATTNNYTDNSDYSSGQETLQSSLSPETSVCTPPSSSKDFLQNPFHVIPDPVHSTRGIAVSDALYSKLCTQFGGLCPNWLHSKAHFTSLIHNVITSLPGQHLFSMRVWSSSPFVIVMDNDGCTLRDVVLECYSHFGGQTVYRHCIQPIGTYRVQNQRTNTRVHPTNTRVPFQSTSAYTSASVNGVQNGLQTPASNSNSNRYHLIYIKPIMERLSKMMGGSNITESMVIQIVDRVIRCGTKRQISKRTFAFQCQRYTVIMSKSLKTILDVAVNGNGRGEVVTVHPDVVSILAKKCPDLDYFTIQKMADSAKRTRRFTVKKNEYRQQFTYEFEGHRIVFASNHSTIVEMERL